MRVVLHTEAIDALDHALELDPNYANAWYETARSNVKKGANENALKDLKSAIKIHEKYYDAASKDRELKTLIRDIPYAKLLNRTPETVLRTQPINEKPLPSSNWREESINEKPLPSSNWREESIGWKEANWHDLLHAIAEQRVTLIIGQGTNYGWLPLSYEIARRWAEEYSYTLVGSNQLSQVAQFLVIQMEDEEYPKHILSKLLRNISPPNFSLEKFRNSPHSLLADLNLPIYITTNYDYFLEEALKSRDVQCAVLVIAI